MLRSSVLFQLQKGVTFLELLVVIAIIGILAAIAAPYYGDYIERQRLVGASEAIFGVMQEAKRSAVSNNRTVYFVAKSNSATDWCATVSENVASVASDCSGGWVTNSSNISPFMRGQDFPTIELLASSATLSAGFVMPGISTVAGNSSITLESPSAWQVQVKVSAPAQIGICGDIGQYDDC